MVKMNIGYICSDEYAKYAGISMLSLFKTNKKVDEINVFIFDKDISDKNKQKISKIVNKYKRKVFFVDGSNELSDILSNITIDSFRGVQHTYAKIFPFVFAKGVDKILVLDSDTIINQDLTDLYNTDISQCYFAAIPEITAWYRSSENPKIIYKNKFYYNSGVLLCNLKKLRTKQYLKKIITGRKNFPEPLKLADQSLLNLSMDSEDIIPVNFKYNYNININLFPELRLDVQKNYNEYGLGIIKDDFGTIAKTCDIAILHYIGINRPWGVGYNAPYASEWVKYFQCSPWKNDKDINKKIKRKLSFKKYFWYVKQKQNFVKKFFCGIKIYEKIIEPNCVKRKYLYGILRSLIQPNSYVFRFLGIPLYRKTEYNDCHRIKILDICVFCKKKSLSYQDVINIMQYRMDLLTQQINMCTAKLNDIPDYIQAIHVNRNAFEKYHGIYAGKRVVLCATGPTLEYYKPIDGAIHVGVNRAFKYDDVDFDYLFAQDEFPEGMSKINNYRNGKCKKFYGVISQNRASVVEKEVSRIAPVNINRANATPYILADTPNMYWPYDLAFEPIGDFQGTVFSALQFILYTQPSEIYLVGCDCSFGQKYSKKQESYNYQMNSWKIFADVVGKLYPNISVFSVNPIGLRGMFFDVYTRDFLQKHPEIDTDDIEVLE